MISASGVAFAVMLILMMWAIMDGILSQAGALVRNTNAQAWVVQKGFTDIAHGFSVLPASLQPKLERIAGVHSANPVAIARSEIEVNGKEDPLSIIGFDPQTGIAGPWKFATVPPKGRLTPREIVVDETFARTAGVHVGDELELSNGPHRVVALSSDTNQFTNQLAFADIADVKQLLRLRDSVGFYAVHTEPGKTRAVIETIRRTIPGVTAFSKAQFTDNNQREIRDGFEPILFVIVLIAFLVGLVVVGLTMYTATVEKSREYGVLSAIGASRPTLYGVIIRQATLTSVLGFAFGCLLTIPAGLLIREIAPKTELSFGLETFGIVAVASVLMALLAAYLPVRRLARLDPAMVFRA